MYPLRARAYFQTLGHGTIMNNFPHMLKIISLCSAPHTMYLGRKSHIAREREDISL